ncbi:MAG: ORF6N domain-containing protein [Desulfobacteraceae bacterium]|nr:ORF6N domain-containing protein [Desulfobacteraceae bacterium]
MNQLIALNDITLWIYAIRGVKVMLDRDLAELYEVETKALKRSVRRHSNRFPQDFMFELTADELQNLRSQIDTSSWGGTRYLPMAFTEQGVAMLSGILNSERAAEVNIQIMRAFVQLRHFLIDHVELKRELDEFRKETNERFKIVFTVIDQLISADQEAEPKIGFIENK